MVVRSGPRLGPAAPGATLAEIPCGDRHERLAGTEAGLYRGNREVAPRRAADVDEATVRRDVGPEPPVEGGYPSKVCAH